ncbi:hypothetical protein ANN_11281 [Periplaneta americana]|uniref:Uncharacterized protein n=1 Tax=Periplaneta americana TaxID=6978 RepID=A0ABQ8T5R4_PERAM|nr:hypothetical protein ANN_11281 [Periplaneta americana]
MNVNVQNVATGFRATGIYLFAPDIIPETAFAPSFVTKRPLEQQESEIPAATHSQITTESSLFGTVLSINLEQQCTERKKSVRWPTKVTDDVVDDARERMQRGPNKSVKKLAVEIGVSYGSAHRILRNKLGWVPILYTPDASGILNKTWNRLLTTTQQIHLLFRRGVGTCSTVLLFTFNPLLLVNEVETLKHCLDAATGLRNTEYTTRPRRDPSWENEKLRANCVCLSWSVITSNDQCFELVTVPRVGRRVFRSQARSIIYNVIKFCDKEKTTGLFLPLLKTTERAAAIVKLNKETIRKEDKECEDKGVEISTPNKVRRPPANRRRRIFCGPLEKELRKRLVKCFVWSVALYGERTWTLRRNEEKRIEAFEMWMWRRTVRVKWTDRIRNKIVFEKVSEERMMLKLIRKRKRNWLGLWLKRIIDDIRICGSYAETKRKAENGKDWRLLCLQ